MFDFVMPYSHHDFDYPSSDHSSHSSTFNDDAEAVLGYAQPTTHTKSDDDHADSSQEADLSLSQAPPMYVPE